MILINDLKTKLLQHKAAIHEALERVLDSGWLVLGSEVKEFEQNFSAYHNNFHCISLANGTDALEIALRSIGIGNGDKVATVANAGMYSTLSILAIQATPVFLDVELATRNVSLSEVQKAINDGVKAIIVTHLYGLAVPDIKEIASLCKNNNVKLIEDCAQSHGAKIEQKIVGTFGDLATFSFYPTKNLGALGDGGCIVTSDSTLANKIKELRQYGWASKYHVETKQGKNSRLDEVQAAFLNIFLPHLDRWNERRREIANTYTSKITNSRITLPKFLGEEYVAHLFVIETPGRESLMIHLKNHGVLSDIHYPVPDYKQTILQEQYKTTRLSNTEQLSKTVLTLPCFPEMSAEQIEKVIDGVNSWQP